ncbi:MAG: hypothetical protein BWK78_05050 [Thiotrichaceae bacterium IS1]|nr:MAG: hypothetical protein BWK78_05050 [Thiotrichaceae bacterium IS1]
MIQEQTDTISCYVPYLYFGKESHRIVNEQFIEPRVKNFFDAREPKILEYKLIDVTQYISDLDWKTVPFGYFYDYILADITKDISSGKIHHVVKYGITLDEQVTSKTCEKTQIKYDEILLNTKPIFYFIYFDLKEILGFLRTSGQKSIERRVR